MVVRKLGGKQAVTASVAGPQVNESQGQRMAPACGGTGYGGVLEVSYGGQALLVGRIRGRLPMVHRDRDGGSQPPCLPCIPWTSNNLGDTRT